MTGQDDTADDTAQLLTGDVNDDDIGVDVYNRRWYVLAVFCYGTFIQTYIWNTWGPITSSAEVVFDWEDSRIGMMANYGNIGFALFVLPMCYFMDVKGLRLTMLICSVLVIMGTGIRCVTLEPVAATWLSSIGAFINGIGGTAPFAGTSAISSLWFPADQRATATATVSFANSMGMALSFIIGPKMVASPLYDSYRERNVTPSILSNNGLNYLQIANTSNTTNKGLINLSQIRTDIRDYLYVLAGCGAVFFLSVLIYFPDKPPKPPSRSASVQRTDYIKGLPCLLRNGKIWLILCTTAIPSGVLGVWQSVLNVNLKPLGISQSEVGYMGFWQIVTGCITGLIVGRFSDIFMRRMKTYLIILYIMAAISAVWFLLLWKSVIPFNIVSMYAACILVGGCINGCMPLFFEIACETSYPVGEGVTGGVLTLFCTITGSGFLFIMLIPNIGQEWMNEALLGSVVLSLPLLFFFPARYGRTDTDISTNVRHCNPDQRSIA